MTSKFLVTIMLASVAILEGCTTCTTEAIAALSVHVVDATTSNPICVANVVAHDGPFSETLMTSPVADAGAGSAGCTFFGVYERAGTYTIDVTSPGYQPNSVASVTVTRDACHVQPQTVTIHLTPM